MLDDPEVVVSELPDPLLPEEPPMPLGLPLVEPELVAPLPDRFGDDGDPLMPPDPVPERVVEDEDELDPVSRPEVESRSEHAAMPRVASAAATATPIARVFIAFINSLPVQCQWFPAGAWPAAPDRRIATPGETLSIGQWLCPTARQAQAVLHTQVPQATPDESGRRRQTPRNSPTSRGDRGGHAEDLVSFIEEIETWPPRYAGR